MQFLSTEYKPSQLQEMLNDRTYGKHVSESRLKAFIAKHDVNALVRVYLRSHLLALCEAYNVAPHNKRETKKVLGLKLIEAVQVSLQIPLPDCVDDRLYKVGELRANGEGQGIVMRLLMTGIYFSIFCIIYTQTYVFAGVNSILQIGI